jgi:hypothetical protein
VRPDVVEPEVAVVDPDQVEPELAPVVAALLGRGRAREEFAEPGAGEGGRSDHPEQGVADPVAEGEVAVPGEHARDGVVLDQVQQPLPRGAADDVVVAEPRLLGVVDERREVQEDHYRAAVVGLQGLL